MKNAIAGSWRWQLVASAFIIGGVATSGNYALGQVVGDTTLGTESSRVTSPRPGGFVINGGATRETNLFHSFQEFSVPTNGFAYFNNALSIQNIVTRVTGASVSNIDGAIAANGTANLFLINPNGIVFGSNASLNLGGSFFASTAASVVFDNGFEFSATNPQAPPLLTINVPLGLQYGSNAGSIQAQGSRLRVRDGKTLALVGGNVQLNGTILAAPGGRIELVGVGGTGTVGLSGNGNNLSLSVPNGVPRADVSLTNEALVGVPAGGGGSIAINARNLNLAGESGLLAGIAPGLGSIDSRAGDIEIRATEAINLTDDSFIANVIPGGGVGKGGSVNITTGSLRVTNGARLSASTGGRGDAGSVTINARDSVSFDGVGSNAVSSAAYSTVEEGAVGKGGGINISTGSLSLTNGAQLQALTRGRGDAGSVTINARDSVSFDGVGSNGVSSAAYSTVEEGAVGKGGGINISTGSLSLTNGAQLVASTFGQGDAGSVTINARESVSFDGEDSQGFNSGVFNQVARGAVGKGGDINLTTGSLLLTKGAQLSASTFGQGDAGRVTINARESVSVNGKDSQGGSSGVSNIVSARAEGNGGDIIITTGSLSVTDGSRLATPTIGRGDAGDIRITARDTVTFARSASAISGVDSEVEGRSGDITIDTRSLFVTDRAGLFTNSAGRGDAGNIRITARDTVSFARGGIAESNLEATGVGRGGDIAITAGVLSVTDKARIGTSTRGQGNAGDIRITADETISVTNGARLLAFTAGQGYAGDVIITARNSVSFDGEDSEGNSSGAFSTVGQTANGKGGSVNITTGSLRITNGAQVDTSTFGQGDAGSVDITAHESVSFDGMGSNGFRSGALSTVEQNAEGKGGNVNINTGSLSVTNGALLSASTRGQGDAGSVTINARDSVSFDGESAASSSVNQRSVGKGGNVNISTGSLSLTNGAQLQALTRGRGDAGSVNVTARESVSFDGVSSNGFRSGALSTVQPGAVGKGGDINITTSSLRFTNGAGLTSSANEQGDGGNIQITARDLLLNNQGLIIAQTLSGNGGNITLNVQDLLLMRRNSLISTTAGTEQKGGNGGNMNINAQFIVAVPKENSDIAADAYTGRGGNINITTQGIYGLQFRPQWTPLSDITASSQLGVDGTVQVNGPDVDPSRGLAELPTEVVDASEQIDRRCTPAGRTAQGNSFTITGRGGLPPSPNDVLQGESVITNWVTLDPQEDNRSSNNTSGNPNRSAPAATTPAQTPTITEASGWRYGANGEVILTAEASNVLPHSSGMMPVTCPGL